MNRGFRENPRGFLEGRRRDERPRLQARLGDAQQNRNTRCRLAAIGDQLVVFGIHFDMVDLFANQPRGFARIGDFNLLQHLAHDDFNVLVVDRHALQTVNFLDFIDEEGGKLFHALDRQNIMRRRIAVEQVFALLDEVAFLHRQMFALRDEILHCFQRIILRHNADAALVLVIAAELDPA